ncbi:MAG: ATP-binding protein, partial [Dehalococcoidia bacterium]
WSTEMTTRSKSILSEPAPTTVLLSDEPDSKPTTSVESSVDIFIVFDEEDQASTSPASSRQHDVPEKSSEEKEHNYYKILFESTADGVFVVDAETMRIVVANQTAAEMYGYDSAEDMMGVSPLSFVHPDDKDRMLRIIAQDVIHNNLRLIHKFRAVAKDGRAMWIRAVGTRTEYQGRLAGLISIRDISQRKQAIEERLTRDQRLEFTSRLASVGELAAGVAHELNDPLSAVLTYGQALMNKKNLGAATKSVLEAIYREALRATAITDNLLALSRRHRPEKGFISINKVVEKALELRSHQMEVNNIEVEVELEPDLPMTMADFHQMQQVFVNIINNAEHAMAECQGHGRLRIQTHKTGEMIRTTFTDDGPGISEDNLARIFDPFFSTKRSGEGTGLGLTVCYGLIEGHNGHIFAKGRLGEGATFVVEIPIISADQSAAGQATPAQANGYANGRGKQDAENIPANRNHQLLGTNRRKVARMLNEG